MVQNPPEGMPTVSPYLLLEGARDFIDFATTALGATQDGPIFEDPRNGLVGHAQVRIGDGVIMVADAMEGFEPTEAFVHVYLDDVDTVHAAAVAAGATSMQEPTDQFYGDRSSMFKDPWGTRWTFSKHIEDVPMDEMEKRMEAEMAADN